MTAMSRRCPERTDAIAANRKAAAPVRSGGLFFSLDAAPYGPRLPPLAPKIWPVEKPAS
jgi:hypothetical protein